MRAIPLQLDYSPGFHSFCRMFRTGSIQHETVPPELQEKVKEMARLITHREIEAKTG
jgi:hypothetical protein